MFLDKDQYNIENDVEFLFERPIGWSSACLDSTINYYLTHNNDKKEKQEENLIDENNI